MTTMYLNVLSFTVLIHMCLHVQIVAKQEDCAKSSMHFNRSHLNVRLSGYAIQNLTVPGVVDCARGCFVLTKCLSFNMATSTGLCEHNSANSSIDFMPNLVADNKFNYFDLSVYPDTIAGTCGKKPCMLHQFCIPTKGKHTCANIECKPYVAPKNGKVKPTTAVIANGNVTVSCRDGFSLVGDSLLTCQFDGHWRGVAPTCEAVRDCYDVLHLGVGSNSGIYTVYLQSNTPFDVHCDMTTDGGGWTVFQYRHDGSVDFYKDFTEYEYGFGDLRGEFWMGLKYIYEMTDQKPSEIYLNFVDSNGTVAMEQFSDFYISAGANYTLNVVTLLHLNDSTSTNNLLGFNGMRFSAKDVDQDIADRHCAQQRHGAWWYRNCGNLNPNGEYVTPGQRSSYSRGHGGMINYEWRERASLKSTKLMFRRV